MKKYLNYLVFVFVLIFSFIPNVFASASKNMSTTYDITTYDLASDLQQVICDNESLYDYFISFINSYDYDNSIYDIVIAPENYGLNYGFEQRRFDLIIVPKNVGFKYQMFGGNYNNDLSTSLNFYSRIVSTSSFRYFRIQFVGNPSCNYKYSDNTQLTELLGYINTGTIPNNFQLHNTGVNMFYSEVIWLDSFNNTLSLGTSVSAYPQSNQSFNGNFLNKNNSNISLDNVIIPFYSSFSLPLSSTIGSYDFGSSIYTYYLKSFNFINYDLTVNEDELFPTYADLYGLFPEGSNFIEYKPQLGTIYTSFSPNQYNNFNLSLTFNTHDLTALQYNQNLNYTWNCYGRINHNNNYYTYEQFPYCDFENNGSYIADSDLLNLTLNNFVIYDSNDNPITDFSSYDKLYFYIDFQYKDFNLNKVVSNLNINFNGNIYYSDDFKGPIYETFNNLPSGFKLFFSTTKNDYSNFYGKYVADSSGSLFSIYRQEYNTSTLNTSTVYGWLTSSFAKYSVNNKLNSGVMFYQNTNSLDESTLYSLEFIIFQDMVISLRNDSSNDFYYSDSTGTIINNDITIDYSNTPTDNYDLSYYLGQVDSFIDDLSSSSLEIANLTQSFYDGLPIFFQTFIFVIFILSCVYFTYLLIKR